MSEAKWTRGPWSVDRDFDEFAWSESHAIGDQDGGQVAHTTRGYGEEQQLATAHLIAAAPELYEALVEAEKALRDPMGPYKPMHKITLALSKARGDQS